MKPKDVFKLLKDTVTEWQEDKVPLWAAALAYYTVFSLAPLLLIAIAIAGVVFGEDAARGEIVGQIQGLVGKEGATAIQSMIQNANRPGSGGTIATVVGVVTLMFGASGVFGQLQDALNTIWGVKPKPGQGIKSFLQARFLSFAMVLVIGFLLLVSLVLSAALAAIGTFFNQLLPDVAIVGQLVNFLVSFGFITLLFAAIYKFLPDVNVAWKDLWIGAAATALLFNVGKLLIGVYLGSSGATSTYGAAGSLVVILLWVFYSAQIILFGAEFTQVFAKYRGSEITPSSHAVRLPRATQSSVEQSVDPAITTQNDSGAMSSKRSASASKTRSIATLLGSVVMLAGAVRRSTPRSRRRKRR
ncbi:MAG: YihY/virulence factor BrkB family protein [Tildeniella nuda ZEHNDER 1965/U140]|jgi:membrane protein|nr:YihY/virulence factor BrkB family protein [Tildeniella nuda ZEHNDER 1965/U140]